MKTYAHYRIGEKVHAADTWENRAACGARMLYAIPTSDPVTCKRCLSIQAAGRKEMERR